ncbi:hypothetical protein [Actinoallomurus sp. CA-150999]|uniref:hypothetical protein n=1 Tax=Actinoallomurus sp. CA-150999 TaxID=3239887 RepID=UPI003D909E29
MFDDVSVVRMEFAEHSVRLCRELLEDLGPAPYVAWKRLTVAQPFTDYAKQHEIPP